MAKEDRYLLHPEKGSVSVSVTKEVSIRPFYPRNVRALGLSSVATKGQSPSFLA